jgi:hypothetical protein
MNQNQSLILYESRGSRVLSVWVGNIIASITAGEDYHQRCQATHTQQTERGGKQELDDSTAFPFTWSCRVTYWVDHSFPILIPLNILGLWNETCIIDFYSYSTYCIHCCNRFTSMYSCYIHIWTYIWMVYTTDIHLLIQEFFLIFLFYTL